MSGYEFELQLQADGFAPIAGADEAGRGACAGPMVAAAVILNLDPSKRIEGLDDSKKLTARRRESLFETICAEAVSWSVAFISPAECDELGMHKADLEGLRRALGGLDVTPACALTDGFFVPGLNYPSQNVVKGDQLAACISAASILAKVTRDRWMSDQDAHYPGYEFAVHKGYCTSVHQSRLEELGPCALHRLSYANVRRAMGIQPPLI